MVDSTLIEYCPSWMDNPVGFNRSTFHTVTTCTPECTAPVTCSGYYTSSPTQTTAGNMPQYQHPTITQCSSAMANPAIEYLQHPDYHGHVEGGLFPTYSPVVPMPHGSTTLPSFREIYGARLTSPGEQMTPSEQLTPNIPSSDELFASVTESLFPAATEDMLFYPQDDESIYSTLGQDLMQFATTKQNEPSFLFSPLEEAASTSTADQGIGFGQDSSSPPLFPMSTEPVPSTMVSYKPCVMSPSYQQMSPTMLDEKLFAQPAPHQRIGSSYSSPAQSPLPDISTFGNRRRSLESGMSATRHVSSSPVSPNYTLQFQHFGFPPPPPCTQSTSPSLQGVGSGLGLGKATPHWGVKRELVEPCLPTTVEERSLLDISAPPQPKRDKLTLHMPPVTDFSQSWSALMSSSPLTTSPTSVAPSNVMSHVPSTSHGVRRCTDTSCAVCGDNASCMHYGVRTCEGCKGFFKRTVQKDARYVCLANKNCPVDKRRRNRCQYCRYQKCLSVGMVCEVVRTGGLKGRRGRLPSKPKARDASPPSPPISFITQLVRAHTDATPTVPGLNYSLFQLPDADPPPLSNTQQQDIFYQLLSSSFEIIKNWAQQVPGFIELAPSDQELLLNGSWLELFILRLGYRSIPNEGRLVFCNGYVLHISQLSHCCGEWMEQIMQFARTLDILNIDISSFAALEALVLLCERSGLQDTDKLEELQARVISSLTGHLIHSQKQPKLFAKLIMAITQLRSLSEQGRQRMVYWKLDQTIPLPESLEKLFEVTMPF